LLIKTSYASKNFVSASNVTSVIFILFLGVDRYFIKCGCEVNLQYRVKSSWILVVCAQVQFRSYSPFLFCTAYVLYYCEHSGVDLMGLKT